MKSPFNTWSCLRHNLKKGLQMIFKYNILLGKKILNLLHWSYISDEENGSFEDNVVFDKNPIYTDSGLFSLVQNTLP
jgi:hypothetical protein